MDEFNWWFFIYFQLWESFCSPFIYKDKASTNTRRYRMRVSSNNKHHYFLFSSLKRGEHSKRMDGWWQGREWMKDENVLVGSWHQTGWQRMIKSKEFQMSQHKRCKVRVLYLKLQYVPQEMPYVSHIRQLWTSGQWRGRNNRNGTSLMSF